MLLLGTATAYSGGKCAAATDASGTFSHTEFSSPGHTALTSGAHTIAEYNANNTTNSREHTAFLISQAELSPQTITLSGLNLDLQNADSRTIDNDATILHVPFFTDGDVLSISGATVIFDAAGTIISTGEVVYTERTDLAGKIEMWQDTQKVLDQEIVVASGKSEDGQNASLAFNWDKLNRCLGNAHISSWVIAAIGVSCSVVCGATLGVGCLACVVAISGITGGTIGNCVAIAM